MTRYALRFRRRDDLGPPLRRRPRARPLPGSRRSGLRVFDFSPDGRYLASGDRPGRALKVWDVDRRAAGRGRPGPGLGTQLAFSPDGRRLLLIRQRRRSSSTTWRPAGSSGPGPGRRVTWPSVPTGPRSRSSTPTRSRQTCRILEAESGRLVRTFTLRSARGVGRLEPGRPDAGDARADHQDRPLGRRDRHPAGDPRGPSPTAACARPSIPPARCWPATAGRAGSGSGTRSWAGPC